MTQRIKITGYINVVNLEPEHIDSSDSTGLSAEGYDQVINGYGVSDLQDLETELVDS